MKKNLALLVFFAVTSIYAIAQQTTITGVIKNSSGQPVPNASINVKGSKNGVVADDVGKFSISAEKKNLVLVINSLGFKSLELNVSGQSNLSIVLEDAIVDASEVVVVGYGSQRKKDATGSISSIKARDLNSVNAVSVDNMLQGKAAGVSILQRSAQPGGGLNIVIRGALSPNGSNEPLYVIDGVPLTTVGAVSAGKTGAGGNNNIDGVDRSPLASINPNDIATIDILKDASAAAIYGAAAANGVVLITTKKGNSGKPTVSFTNSYSSQSVAKQAEVLGAKEFMNLSNIALKERWLFDNRYAPYGTTPAPSSGWGVNYTPADIAAATTSYNHNDAIFRTGTILDNNLSISGGNDATKYYASFNYLDQKSLLRTTDFARVSGRINLDQTFNKWLKLSLNTFYSQSDANNPSIGGSRTPQNEARQTQAALFFSPRIPLINLDGSLAINDLPKTPNPAAWFLMKDRSINKRFFISANLQAKITSEINANVVLGYDNTNAGRQNFSPTTAKLPEQPTSNFGGFSNNENNNFSLETYFTYNKQFGIDHKFTAVLGAGYYKANGTNYGMSVFNIPTDVVENYNLSLAPQSDLNAFYSGKFARTKISQFGRINYSYRDKYFFGLTARNDGSSSFPPAKKWGFFPAVSAAWNISDEKFLMGNKILNSLKLRASYGATGNESFLANNIYYVNQYAAVYGTNYYLGGQQNSGVIQTQLANPNLKWETDITTNIGIDFEFFKGRITGSFDLFERTAKDLLDFARLPFNSSITFIAQNVGSTRSRGFDFALNGKVIEKRDLNWTLNMNISRSFVSWAKRNPNVALSPWIGETDGVFDIYGWQTNGFFKSDAEVKAYKSGAGAVIQPGSFAGNPRYIDQNNDGKLNQLDLVKLGNYDPSFNFGLGTSLQYKSFDLNIQTYGFIGRSMFDGWQSFGSLYILADKVNQHVSVRDVWSSVNQSGTRPGVGGGPTEANNPTGITDYFLTKVNFLRLKNITFGYRIPSDFLQKNKIIKSARLFVDFQNLAVLTNYSGLDPEMELNASPFPIPRTTAVGINIIF